MLNAFAIDCIERVRLGFMASVTPSGRPSVSPKGTFVVLDEHRLAFGEIRSPGTISDIGPSPAVDVNFVDSFTRKGWLIRGTTSVLCRGSAAFDAIYPQWQFLWGDLVERINVIVTINITEVKPLSSPPMLMGRPRRRWWPSTKKFFAYVFMTDHICPLHHSNFLGGSYGSGSY